MSNSRPGEKTQGSPSSKRAMLRVALDTTFAGLNNTGVGIYSRKLAEGLGRLAEQGELELKCVGPSCESKLRNLPLDGIYQEWPTYTHAILPIRLAKYRPHVVHSTSHLGPLWGHGSLVVTVHDLIFMRYPKDYEPAWLGLTRALLPVAFKRAPVVIADWRAQKPTSSDFSALRVRRFE